LITHFAFPINSHRQHFAFAISAVDNDNTYCTSIVSSQSFSKPLQLLLLTPFLAQLLLISELSLNLSIMTKFIPYDENTDPTNIDESVTKKEGVPDALPLSTGTEDSTQSSSTAVLIDELDYLCDFLLHWDISPKATSPMQHNFERQRRDRQALVQKRRMRDSPKKDDNHIGGHKHCIERVVPVNQKRVRVADTLLFVREGHVIGEEDLTGSVRTLHIDETKKEIVDDPVCDIVDDSIEKYPHYDDDDDDDDERWHRSRRLWAGVAVAAVTIGAAVLVKRKR
jgi:hypothetical protein